MGYPIKIMQIGDGAFLRGYWDLAIKQLNVPASVVSVAATPRGVTNNILKVQKGSFHILERGIRDGVAFEAETVVDVIKDVVNPFTHWDDFLEYAHSNSLEMIVSNTTEAGIYYEQTAYPEACPISYAARLTLFLKKYYDYFNGGKQLTIVPLELIQDNGVELRRICLLHSKDWGFEIGFTKWLGRLIFCNTLVDRIVIGSSTDIITDDQLYTVCEPYFLFVSDQKYPFKDWPQSQNLPFVYDELDAYHLRKVGILNGSHIVLAALGKIFNFETVREAISDAGVKKLIRAMTSDFTTRYNVDPSYQDTIFDRFMNPFIDHRLFDIQLNELSKWKVRIAPYAHSDIYYQILAIGIYSLNPLKFVVRESEETLDKISQIYAAFARKENETMIAFIQEYFNCSAEPILKYLLSIDELLKDIV